MNGFNRFFNYWRWDHRDQHRLPEDVEEKEIQRDEDPDHGGFEEEKRDVELLDPLLDLPERRQDDERHQKSGQNVQNLRNVINVH